MSSTTFSPGTTVTSTWLNDVNTVTYKNQRSVIEFGAVGNGVTNDTTAIQNTINAVSSAGGGVVTFPVGTFLHGQITLKPNVVLQGTGLGTVLKVDMSLFGGGNANTGAWIVPGGIGGATNITVQDLVFDGGRIPNPGNDSVCIFYFNPSIGETVTNITFKNNYFYDAAFNFIMFEAGYIPGVNFNNIVVKDNHFFTTVANRDFGGSARFQVAWDALCVQTYDYFGSNGQNSYGTIIATNIKFIGNHCESIRTGADIRRGCHSFVVTNNTTHNMNDCHHSSDGSYDGLFSNNTCKTDSTYVSASSTFTNAFEVQGEHINIQGNTVDGGGQLINGIYVTDYGIPGETGNRGHQAVCVNIRNNNLSNISTVAYKMDNGISCSITNNSIETCGSHTVGVSSGSSRTDGTNPLLSIGVTVSGNSCKSATTGVFISGNCVGASYGWCIDENGNDFFDIPTTPGPTTTLSLTSAQATFKNIGTYHNLCPDPFFQSPSGTGSLYWQTNNAITGVAGFQNAPSGGTVTDPNAGSIQTALSGTATQAMRYTLKLGQMIYIRFDARESASSGSVKCGVRVREFNSSNVQQGSDYWYGYSGLGTGSPTSLILRHTGQASGFSYITVELAPAATFAGDAASTGNVDFSNIRISYGAPGNE